MVLRDIDIDIKLFAELIGRRRRTIHEESHCERTRGHNFLTPPIDGVLALAAGLVPSVLVNASRPDQVPSPPTLAVGWSCTA